MRTDMMFAAKLIKRHFISILLFVIVSVMIFYTFYRGVLLIDLMGGVSADVDQSAETGDWLITTQKNPLAVVEGHEPSPWGAEVASVLDGLGAVATVSLANYTLTGNEGILLIGNPEDLIDVDITFAEQGTYVLGAEGTPGVRDGQMALPWNPENKGTYIALTEDTRIFSGSARAFQNIDNMLYYVVPWSYILDEENFGNGREQLQIDPTGILFKLVLTKADRNAVEELQQYLPIDDAKGELIDFQLEKLSTIQASQTSVIKQNLSYVVFLLLISVGIYLGMKTFMRQLIQSEMRRFTIQKITGASDRQIRFQLNVVFWVLAVIPILLMTIYLLLGVIVLSTESSFVVHWYAHPVLFFALVLAMLYHAWRQPIDSMLKQTYTELFRTM